MTDIVERLNLEGHLWSARPANLFFEAADEIEKLRAEVAQARDAIENHSVPKSIYTVTAADLAEAEAALADRDALIAEALDEWGTLKSPIETLVAVYAILSRAPQGAADRNDNLVRAEGVEAAQERLVNRERTLRLLDELAAEYRKAAGQ